MVQGSSTLGSIAAEDGRFRAQGSSFRSPAPCGAGLPRAVPVRGLRAGTDGLWLRQPPAQRRQGRHYAQAGRSYRPDHRPKREPFAGEQARPGDHQGPHLHRPCRLNLECRVRNAERGVADFACGFRRAECGGPKDPSGKCRPSTINYQLSTYEPAATLNYRLSAPSPRPTQGRSLESKV